MDIFKIAEEGSTISDEEIVNLLEKALADWELVNGDVKKALIIPPDFTRFHSNAGFITQVFYHLLKATDAEVDEKVAEQAKSVEKDVEEYKKNMDPRQFDYIRSDIVITKLFDMLKANNEMFVEEEKAETPAKKAPAKKSTSTAKKTTAKKTEKAEVAEEKTEA